MMQDILLSKEDNQHSWRLEGSGQFTSKSAYLAFFNGSTTFEPWLRIWKTWDPGKCKVFLWLAIRNRCWTADRLQKRGLPHPDKSVLCDQEVETVQHILTSCVFAHDFWFKILAPLDLYHVSLDVVITLSRLGGRRPANVWEKLKGKVLTLRFE